MQGTVLDPVGMQMWLRHGSCLKQFEPKLTLCMTNKWHAILQSESWRKDSSVLKTELFNVSDLLKVYFKWLNFNTWKSKLKEKSHIYKNLRKTQWLFQNM